MYMLLLLTYLLLSARNACGSPITPHQNALGSTGIWTILDHRIACTPTECHYSFNIAEKPTSGKRLQQPQDSTHCEFLVDTDDDPNTGTGAAAAALPANRTSFQDKSCGLNQNNYTVNGGFMNNSALVLCFQNPQEGSWAFFGFDPWEFLLGPQKSSPAYPIGTFANGTSSPPRIPLSSAIIHGRGDSDDSVKFLWGQRIAGPSGIYLQFSFESRQLGLFTDCEFFMEPPYLGVDTTIWSFNSKGFVCEGKKLFATWVYSPMEDTGTLMVYNTTMEPWTMFTWPNVNYGITLAPTIGFSVVT